jgi:hypothetical protein
LNGDWKGAKKVEMPYKEVQHNNPKEKTTNLLELSTQPEDHTKAHNIELSIETTYFILMLHHL